MNKEITMSMSKELFESELDKKYKEGIKEGEESLVNKIKIWKESELTPKVYMKSKYPPAGYTELFTYFHYYYDGLMNYFSYINPNWNDD